MATNLERPIFLVGCGKSGTTLLSLLMLLHSKVGPKGPDQDKYNPQQYLDLLLTQKGFDRTAHLVERKDVWDRYFPVLTELRIGKELELKKSPLSPDQVTELKKELTVEFSQDRYLGKQPFNTFRIHVLRELFPDCHIVAIHRDGRDVAASWGNRVAHGWQKFGGYENALKVYARKWSEAVNHIETYKNELDVFVIRYEDLVMNTSHTLKEVFSHVDLEYEQAVYDTISVQNNIGNWIERIPVQYHQNINELTSETRVKLAYPDDPYEKYSIQPFRELLPSQAGFEDFYRSAKKQVFNCPVCGGDRFRHISNANRHKIQLSTSVCESCLLVQCNPRPVKDWFSYFYQHWFWSVYIGKQKPMQKMYEEDIQDEKGEVIGEFILSRKDLDKPGASFLDVGCGMGGLVSFLHNTCEHLKVHAIDPSVAAVEYVQSKNDGVTAVCQNLDNIGLDEKFDAISMVHVLEHVWNPKELLIKIAGLLKEDGLVYIEVPDILSDQWKGHDFLHIAHLYNFCDFSFHQVASEAGFKVLEYCQSPVRTWGWAKAYVLAKSAVTLDSSLSKPTVTALIDHINDRIEAGEKGFLKGFDWGEGVPGPRTLRRLWRHVTGS